MKEQREIPKPFSQAGMRMIIGKVVFIYSVFFIIMQVIAVFEKKLDFIISLIISFPFMILSILGFVMFKNNKFTWLYNILGIIIISAIRYFQLEIYNFLTQANL